MKQMPDRGKVMTWLEICGKNNDCSGCCPYSENGFGEYGQCRESLMADAYDLLKEQEPKLVRIDEDSVHCPSCGNELFTFPRQKFCDECGQAVKWE